MSVTEGVVPLFGPRPAQVEETERELFVGALEPGEAAAWAQWLAAETPASWRPGEWDPAVRLFTGDVENQSTVIHRCTVVACSGLSRTRSMCEQCRRAFRESGAGDATVFRATFVPERNRVIDGSRAECVVAGCPRDGLWLGLCAAHGSLLQKDMKRGRAPDLATWIASAGAYDPLPPCLVAGCDRDGRAGSGICDLHTYRLQKTGRAEADPAWIEHEPPYLQIHQFSLAPLVPLVRSELLYALAMRDEGAQRLDPTAVRQLVEVLGTRVSSVAAVALQTLPKKAAANVDALLRETFRVVGAAFDRFRGVDPASRPVLDMAELRLHGTHGKPTSRPGKLDLGPIAQDWLRGMFADWVAEARPSTAQARDSHRGVREASRALAARRGGGANPAMLGFADMNAIVEVFNHLLRIKDGKDMAWKSKAELLSSFFKVLDFARLTGKCPQLSSTFTRHPSHVIKPVDDNEDRVGKAIPEYVIDKLDEHMDLLGAGVRHGQMSGEQVAAMARCVYVLLRETGRRPYEIGQLDVDCIEHNGRNWLLRYDNSKAGRMRRRLPVHTETAEAVQEWLAVRATIELPGGSQAFLFPPAGEYGQVRHLSAEQIARLIRSFADSVPELLSQQFDAKGDRIPFDRALIFPYAFRHSFCQRYADAGMHPDVLRDLMDHESMQTTQGYYTVSLKRKEEAIAKVAPLGVGRGASLGEVSATAYEAESLAVPFGNCKEPSNVKSGGKSCPIAYQCAGCDYFSTDPSHIVELEEEIARRRREREWAISTGAEEFIIDNLTANINRFGDRLAEAKAKLDGLDPEERAEMLEHAAVVRRSRAGIAGRTFLGPTIVVRSGERPA